MKQHLLTLMVMVVLVPFDMHAQLNDCVLAQVICDDANFGFNPIGPGFDDFADPDNHPGCIVDLEQNSAWYYFEIDPNAPPDLVLGFIIDPNGGFGEDYDWALFGPDVGCGDLGSPIRCSSSDANCGFCPQTGMGMGATDITEGPGTGDGFVSTLVVQPGQGFYLLIDNWLGTNNGFMLTWTDTAAEWLNCDAETPCSITSFAGSDINACEGDESFQLNGGSYGGFGAETYSWSGTNGGTAFLNDPNIPDPTVTLPAGFTGTIIYTLTVAVDTCEGVDEVELTVNPLPGIIIDPVEPLCANASPETLTATPPGGTWGGGATGNMLNPATLGSGIHEVTYTYTDFNNCTNTASIFVEVYEIPAIEIDPEPASFCDVPGEVLLTANVSGGAGGYSFAWSTPTGPGEENTFNATYAGVHTVSVTDANGCVGTAAVDVVSHVNPEPEILNAGSICNAIPFFTLVATPAGGEFDGANITPEGELYPNLLNPGTYTITYTYIDNNNCVGIDMATITIVTAPNAMAANNGPFCAGQPIELSGTTDGTGSSVTYHWTGPNGFTSDLQNPVNATDSGTYTLVVNVDGCISAPSTTVVQLVESPDAIAANDGPYCNGQVIQLSGSTTSNAPNITYNWTGPNGYTSSLQNPADATNAGLYVLITTAGNCVSEPDTTEVIFNPAPDASATNTGPYCAGEQIELFGSTSTAGTTITYDWTGPNGYTSSLQNPAGALDPGSYQLVVTVDGCASLTQTTDVIINALPQPVITGQSSFCTGLSSTLDAGGGFANYQWSDGSMNQTLEVFASGSFQVTVTDINGCTGEATFDVTETPSLMPVISGSLQFCEGSNTILDAGSGYAEYIWSTGETAQVITVTDEDQYSVTVTDVDGCSGAAAVTTMIHDNPDVMIGGSTTYCIGGSTTLDAGSGYTSYLWSNGSSTQTILVTTPGTFTVDVVDINGCTGSATVTVNESTSLSPVITGINAFCENGSTILNAGSGFASYQWSDGSTGQTLLVNTAGMYSVSVSDGQGCFGNSSVTVTEIVPPFAQLMPNATICNRQGMASIMDLYDLVIAGDMNGTWSDIDQSGAQGLFNNLDFSNVAAGDYRFMYTTNSATAPCPESEYEVVITVNESPDVLIASAPMLDCNNASVMLDADGSSTGPEYDILWTGPGIVVDGNEKTLHPTIDKPGNYQLMITNTLTGCAGTSSVVVNQNADAPSGAIIIANEKKCSADEDASIFIQSVSGGTAPYQFQLNNGAFTSQDLFNNLLPGDYSIVVEDANGCRWDTMITFSAPNIFSIDLGSDIEIELGESAFIQAIVTLPPGLLDTIIWTPQNGIQCLDPFCAEVDASVIGTQLLTATAIDINGCEESDEILITVDRERKLFIPTAFSPNGDGYNDEFYIQGNAHKIESILKFEVYTRWGELLYSAGDIAPNDPSKGWDGKYKNHFINPGVYVYKAEIRYADGFTENLTGDVTVVR